MRLEFEEAESDAHAILALGPASEGLAALGSIRRSKTAWRPRILSLPLLGLFIVAKAGRW